MASSVCWCCCTIRWSSTSGPNPNTICVFREQWAMIWSIWSESSKYRRIGLEDLFVNFFLWLRPLVLYDKPYTFHELSCEEKHDLWSKFKLSSSIFGDEEDESRTVFTEIIDGEAQLRADRPVLIVSSTSWTKDEDFQILLDALYLLDTQHARDTIRNGQDLKVICVITGKGPMKQYYTDKLKTLSFVHTKFIFPWLVAEDYPKLLACADVGVSLHKSSSGVDLPMKVVDMFGCGLPVCAYSYRWYRLFIFQTICH